MVESGGTLTIEDSNTAAPHYFTPDGNGLWVLDESGGTETVAGGVITGGTGKPDDRHGDSGGGVYIGGGVVHRLGLWFDQSPFRERFEAKGRFQSYLSPIPCWVIDPSAAPALQGAARALDLAGAA